MAGKKASLLERLKEKQVIKMMLKKDFNYAKSQMRKVNEMPQEEVGIEKSSAKRPENEERDLNKDIATAIALQNKSMFRREDTTADNIWFALINPERAIEVRAWLMSSHLKALILKGPKGENMLHWAVLSEAGLVLDLIDVGININSKDDNGLTPMDWIVERFWELCVINDNHIPYHGILKLRAQTEELGLLTYSLGGRTSDFEQIGEGNNNSAAKMAMAGFFWYMEALYKDKGIDFLKGWLHNKRSVLHVWILSNDDGMKYKHMQQMIDWGLSINEKDADGRTPLWYLVEGWSLSKENKDRVKLIKTMKEILKMGADPDIEDNEGISPRLIISPVNGTLEDISYIENIFNEYYTK